MTWHEESITIYFAPIHNRRGSQMKKEDLVGEESHGCGILKLGLGKPQ